MNVPHGNQKYDWAKLADGKVRKFRRNRQFHCTASAFRNQILGAAKSLGLRAKTSVSGDVVVFQFGPKFDAIVHQK